LSPIRFRISFPSHLVHLAHLRIWLTPPWVSPLAPGARPLANLLSNSFLDPSLSIILVKLDVPFYSLLPRSGHMWGVRPQIAHGPGHIKSSRMSPRRCIPPDTHFTPILPCTPPHTILTIPAPAASPTFLSQSCPYPPPLIVTQHGLPAPTHAKDQILRAPVSTIARHSAATAVIVDPTPQIALSAAVATEVVSSRRHARSAQHSSPLAAVEFSDSII
jgi:hypothetical protein